MYTQKQRQSNFELLRIISMLLIVAHHYVYYGGLDIEAMPLCANKLILQGLLYGGKLGVNLFVLISGYFLINAQSVRQKLIRLWVDATVFSLVPLVAALICGRSVDLWQLLRGFLPIPYSAWWFISVYFLLLLFSGYINRLIAGLSRRQLDGLIVLMSLLFSFLPTFLITQFVSSKLLWFVLLYLIAARIRLYPSQRPFLKHSLLIGIGLYALCLLSCVAVDIIKAKLGSFPVDALYFSDTEKFPMLLAAVFIFYGFKSLSLRSKTVNLIASGTFGVYLLHENEFIRPLLWQTLFNNAAYAQSRLLPLYALAAIAAVFAGCTVLALLYSLTLGKVISLGVGRVVQAAERRFYALKAKRHREQPSIGKK